MEDNRSTAGVSPRGMNEILERLLDEAEGGAPPPSAPSPPTPASVPPPPPSPPHEGGQPSSPMDGGAGMPLMGLLSNPALLAALPTVMENLSPLMGNLSRGVGSAPTATRPHTVDRHTALLCAIKPYLSPRRQEAAETVIRLCRVWDALERSGIHVGDLFGGLGAGAGAPPPREGRAEDV